VPAVIPAVAAAAAVLADDEGPSAAELQRVYDERASRQAELFTATPASDFDPLPVPDFRRPRESENLGAPQVETQAVDAAAESPTSATEAETPPGS
jgi:hypothetical protein